MYESVTQPGLFERSNGEFFLEIFFIKFLNCLKKINNSEKADDLLCSADVLTNAFLYSINFSRMFWGWQEL